MAKIEILDLDENVTEMCEATPEKRTVDDDDTGTFCEDGEAQEARRMCEGDVYRWTTKDGMTFQACAGHIELDDFCRFAYEIGDKVAFEFDPGKERIGKVIDIDRSFPNHLRYKIAYRGSRWLTATDLWPAS